MTLSPELLAMSEDALGYATRLATLMAEKHYPDRSTDWKPLTDIVGILTQIDNMVAGMVRADGTVKKSIVSAVDALTTLRQRFVKEDPEWEGWGQVPTSLELLNSAFSSLQRTSSRRHPYEDPLKAIEFSLQTSEGIEFLRLWQHGQWKEIDQNWPEFAETLEARPA
jgi:hypothetical protein